MPRIRPAPLPRELPDAGTARRRARAGTGLVVALLVLPFAVGGMVRSGAAVGLVTGPVAFLLWVELCAERAPTRCSSARMTARTLTGIRSVDLRRIASVRLRTTFSYGTVHRALLVRDAHGVRLGVTSTAGRRALRRALERQPGVVMGRRPRVSRAARVCLGTGRPGQLAVHTVLVFLAQVGLVCAYVVALVEAGGIG
ncbi:hypothetical protein [Streptomyces sp. P3]|uniref:hypothetical protein n=1 Tax=Streptomyces sp. P3 TaxID=2135430 RepID=UPI001C1F4B7F|nr:hypothetical protein [Streptomyces sp. P3]